MRRTIAYLSIMFAALVSAAAGAGQALDLTREQALIDSGTIDRFAKENLASFSVTALTNGIPVILKRSTTNRVLTLKLVLRGHVSFTPVAKAGLEAVMLKMMTRGSAHYGYPEMQRAMFETSSTFTPTYTSFDMTSLDLVTLDTYFDRTFPVFADAFLHPAWDQEEFPRVIKELTLSAQQSENNPFTLSDDLLHESFFAGHPYEASWQGAGYSLEAITLDDVKAYFAQKVSPARLFLVAVGNFDEGKLLSQLNATFGTMPRGSYQRPPVPSFENSVKPGLLVQTYEQSAGLAYMEACFAMPSPESGDYPAALVAFNVLDDLLFEIVRGQNGACYSIWTSLFGGSASFGEISVYRTPVPGKIKRLVDDAIAVLVSGHGTAGGVASTEPGEKAQPAARPVEDFVALGDVLPFYKTKLLTQFYTGQQTNTAIAAQIASSVVYHGDYRDYLLTLSRVQSVTAEDVVRVVRKYLVQAPALWIALGDPALLKDMSQGDFQSFTGKVAAAPFVSR